MGITLAFALLALWYAAVTPIFEISDEVSHYPVVDYIADHFALPVQDTARTREYDWEAAQPPLYYAIAALLVKPFNRDDMESYLVDNPHAKVGIGLARDNHNFVLHDVEREAFPWRGTPLHVRIVRVFSVILGTSAVWWVFAVGRLAVPENPTVALVAQLLTAFNPMFIAVVGSINNDNLILSLVPVALAILLTIWRDGFTWGRVVALALVCTLCAASKTSGLVMFVPSGLGIALAIWKEGRPIRQLVVSGVIFVVIWLGLFGWWYVRNWHHYGDFIGTQHMAETVGLRENPITIPELLRDESFSFYAAYWGWFGAVNILAPMSLFYYTGGVLALAGIGLTIRGVRARVGWSLVPASLLALTVILALGSLIQWTLLTPASQGRLMFPFSAAIHTLAAIGLVTLVRGRLAVLLTSLLGFFAVYCIAATIPHAFRLPRQLDNLPASANAVDVRYGAIQFLGYQVDDAAVKAGETLPITLYWRADGPTETPLSLYVQVYGPDETLAEVLEVGKVDSYPGRGLMQTDTWRTGVIYEDTYHLEIADLADVPFVPRFKIGWRDQQTETEIGAMDGQGAEIEAVVVGGGRVVGENIAEDASELARFGDSIRLLRLDTTQTESAIIIEPTWAVGDERIAENFTVFVQLIPPNAPPEPVAFGDSFPRGGWWPTSAWEPHSRFDDRYILLLPDDLPPDEYTIAIGFYRPSDFTRLPVVGGAHPDSYQFSVRIGD